MSIWARLLAVLATAFVFAACGTAMSGAARTTPSSKGAAPTTAGNERTAQLDAPALLTKLNLPAMAVRAPTEPTGDDGMLRPRGALIGNQAHAVARAWWTVPASSGRVLAYVTAHPPAGAKLFATGSVSDWRHHLSSERLEYAWPAISGVLGDRELAITLVALAGGGTGVLAEAQSDWVVTRPSEERIPGGVHEVDVTSAKLEGPTAVSLHVTSAAEVRGLVSLIDAMPIVQPVAIACPALIGANARVIALRFRTALGGALLARATYTDYGPDLRAPSGQCTSIEFTLRGRRETPLIGGHFVEQLQQLLGVKLLGG